MVKFIKLLKYLGSLDCIWFFCLVLQWELLIVLGQNLITLLNYMEKSTFLTFKDAGGRDEQTTLFDQ